MHTNIMIFLHAHTIAWDIHTYACPVLVNIYISVDMVLPENPVEIMIFPLQALKVTATYVDILLHSRVCTSKIKGIEQSNSKNQILQSW